jgi:hypothetical protein
MAAPIADNSTPSGGRVPGDSTARLIVGPMDAADSLVFTTSAISIGWKWYGTNICGVPSSRT